MTGFFSPPPQEGHTQAPPRTFWQPSPNRNLSQGYAPKGVLGAPAETRTSLCFPHPQPLTLTRTGIYAADLSTIFLYSTRLLFKNGKRKLEKYREERKVTPLLEKSVENILVYFLPSSCTHFGALNRDPEDCPPNFGPVQEGSPGSSPHYALGLCQDRHSGFGPYAGAGRAMRRALGHPGNAERRGHGGDAAVAPPGPSLPGSRWPQNSLVCSRCGDKARR